MKAIFYSAVVSATFLSLFAKDISAFRPVPLVVSRIRSRGANYDMMLSRGTPLPSWQTNRPLPHTRLAVSPLKDDTKTTSPLVKLASSPIGALVVLLGVVLFHECGHYCTARAFGVHPQEFSIGFGPKLLGFQALGDQFNLRALPLGGYVSFTADQLQPLPWNERVVISSAGVVFNLILAFFIYFRQIAFGAGLTEFIFDPGVLVTAVAPDAAASGILRPGDVIVGVNGAPITISSRSLSEAEAQRAISKIIGTVKATPDGESLQLSILRSNRPRGPLEVSIEPKCAILESTGKPGPKTIGVFLEPNVAGVELLQSDSLLEAAVLAYKDVLTLTRETAIGLRTLVGDFFSAQESNYKVSGPIGVIQRASSVVATQDWNTVLQYAAAISINFGVVNMLPIPPLDGFQVFYTLVEALWQSQFQS